MTRQRRSEPSPDGGFTLTELLISIVLFGIVSAMVTTASITGLQRQTQVANRNSELAAVRTALQRIDRDIRSASPLLAASATQLVLEEAQYGLTRVMTYTVSGSKLTVDQTTTDATGTTRTAAQKVLLADLVSTGTPVFAFRSKVGYTAPTGVTVDSSTCAMSGGTIDIGCVGTITVSVTTRPEHVAGTISLSDNGVDLRNAS